MGTPETHTARCFCGSVEFTVTGEPVAMGYCHCSSCRNWSAAPVTAFTLWPPSDLTVLKGVEHVASYNRTGRSLRRWCMVCGGHLFSELPNWDLVDVYPSLIPSLTFEPAVHVHYQETVLPMKDGLPKLKDLPRELGGSGDTLPE
jgi:hypothetical protein